MPARIKLRKNSAILISPLAIGIPMFYYFFEGGKPPEINFSYAPLVVSYSLTFVYSFAYATASSLSAWESGKLREYKIWKLGPARSQYAVAARTLLAPITLSWMVLTLPVVTALVQTGTLPTLVSLGPLFMGMVLCVAHAVVGFAVGSRVPPLIAAPILAAGTWVVVAFSMANREFWMRHVSGQFSFSLMFGEVVPSRVLLPPLLFTGAIALGIILLWIRNFHWTIRAMMAAVVSIVGMSTAINLTSGWGHTPPLLAAQAPMECLGNSPRVCLPEAMHGSISEVHAEVASTLKTLRDSGVKVQPKVVTDSVVYGRYPKSSTTNKWYVGFTQTLLTKESVRYRIGFEAAKFDCKEPNIEKSRSVRLWVATIIGEADEERKRIAVETTPFDGQRRVEGTVERILRLPEPQQAEWFDHSLTEACVGRK
ncbi:hypothetical protein [Streptomyces atratus]|uniref:hypothetical protein n=1 Tax=Streptomyces atratus TaxID=1893 RepID=UPI0037A6A5F3